MRSNGFFENMGIITKRKEKKKKYNAWYMFGIILILKGKGDGPTNG